jgi:putative transposase
MRSHGTAAGLEARRRAGVAQCDDGWTRAAVADVLGVHPVTVAKWMARYRRDGASGLAAGRTPGRPRFLSADQERQGRGRRTERPTAHGFRTDLWAARRVADRSRRRFGVAFHPDAPRARPRARGDSPQKPRRRARQKDQPAIDRRVAEDGPRIQKSRRGERPPRPERRDRAVPQPAGEAVVGEGGQTPVIGADGGHRDKVSVIGAVSGFPAGRRWGFDFATAPAGFFTADKVVASLRDLLRHLRGNVVVVWDRGGNHKGPVIRRFLARNRRLWLEVLPPWAPELNPVEPVWSWRKASEWANVVPPDVAGLDDEIGDRLIQSKCDPPLLRALWERSERPFPKSSTQSLCLHPRQ